MSVEENIKDTSTWTRGFFILIFGVIYYLLFFLLILLVVFQFFTKLLTTELNSQLLEFSDGLTRYITQILGYVTFKTEERPYPFNPWPAAEATQEQSVKATPARKKKTSRKKSTVQKKTSAETADSDKDNAEKSAPGN